MIDIKFPLCTSRLNEYIPHRPPMLWVNEVLSVTEKTGVCRVIFNSEAHYCDFRGRLRQTAFVEWIAQSYGFVKATQVAMGLITVEKIPKVTFLAQIRDAQFPSVPAGNTHQFFDVFVQCDRILGSLSLVKGVVKDDFGQEHASCSLKLFAD